MADCARPKRETRPAADRWGGVMYLSFASRAFKGFQGF